MKFRYTSEEKATLWLDSFDLTFHQKETLLAGRSAMDVVSGLSVGAEEICSAVPSEELHRMKLALADGGYLPRLLSELESKDIFFVIPSSADYPSALRELPAHPLILYCKGDRRLLTGEHFSVVGSRKILPWTKKLTERVVAELARHFTVVTGFAEGGDESVIRGVLTESQESKLVCVLANGFDHVYPASHATLMKEVADHGLLISEVRPEIRPQKFLFPVRNRIIAGMSRGVLIVGAGKRSGTSVTAGYALEYGRDIFAFPYNPGIAEGEGCNELIRTGAYLVTGAAEILSVYGIAADEAPMPELSEDESKVWEALRECGELHVEQLSARLSLDAHVVSGVLVGLEVKGLVVRSGGNRYTVVGNG